MTDEEIISLFFERSEQAISELAAKHGKAVARIVRNILSDEEDVKECVNDTWLGVWNSIPPNRPDPLRAYVCRIARNLAAKRYHANTAEKRNSQYDLALEELAECIPDRDNVEDTYGAKELAAAISSFLDTLDYRDKFLFMRRYWYADSLSDIAAMSGLGYKTVSVRLTRVKAKLKKHLMEEGLLV
jgi:RNA polymerase sigma-70 factor (ECF subfamily)